MMQFFLRPLFSTLLLWAICFPGITIAQDFHLSQYDAAPLNLNPAMTGNFNGLYRIHAHYRTQWSSIINNPYVTTGLSFDMPYKKMKLGAQVMNLRAGTGGYNVFSLILSAAYDIAPIASKPYHRLAGGLQLGFTEKSFNPAKLTFYNQYSAFSGNFDQNIGSGEIFANSNAFLPEVNSGLLYYYANESSRIRPFAGASFFHLTHPKETFFDYKNYLPLRMLFHGGASFDVTEKIQLIPKVFFMKQSNAKELVTSISASYYLEESDAYLLFGTAFRSKDAMIIDLGLKYGKFIYRLSYDVNTSSLYPTSNGRGGLELSVTYIAKKQKPNPIPNCPRL